MELDAPQPSKIDARTEIPAGTYVCLEVRDSGAGMDATAMERLFEPCFTTKFTGRGLGLSALSGIVRGHRGGVEVVAPGRRALRQHE